ncbi:hypothetical protein FHW69_002405 [Luteibacter sp. Sphag1AF]|uniref:hypothetical protein n=1 Tax=Luteibacter sp. Sphag1AF TaxID=2587031 RepID=UPI00161087A9|nr:hypothetical protein [Luteibacter sp. Sphag1AF]MBB3227773.1 hypothetical protein [Luteibacter sp. Sphag1AF]
MNKLRIIPLVLVTLAFSTSVVAIDLSGVSAPCGAEGDAVCGMTYAVTAEASTNAGAFEAVQPRVPGQCHQRGGIIPVVAYRYGLDASSGKQRVVATVTCDTPGG